MDKIINLGIPHVAENIFESIDTPELVQCALVSETWKVLAENVLLKRWNGKIVEASKCGETKVVQLLLEHSNQTDEEHYQFSVALMTATRHGHKDVVGLLLDRSNTNGINICLSARYWKILCDPPFMIACINGCKEVVQMFLNFGSNHDIDVNARDKSGDTAFIHACRNGHKDVVQLLLDYSDRFRNEIKAGAMFDLNRYLKLNATNNCGYTGFIVACREGQEDVVKLLLNHFENPDSPLLLNATDINGLTGFKLACINGRINVVKLLLDYTSGESENVEWWKHYFLPKEIEGLLKHYFVPKEVEELLKKHPRKRHCIVRFFQFVSKQIKEIFR